MDRLSKDQLLLEIKRYTKDWDISSYESVQKGIDYARSFMGEGKNTWDVVITWRSFLAAKEYLDGNYDKAEKLCLGLDSQRRKDIGLIWH